MARGILYICSTVVDGIIKIGKTQHLEDRMRSLSGGYNNVAGIKKEFAIEVNDYSEKEKLIQRVFKKSQVGDSELFALDIEIAKQLLSSFEGNIIYPKGVKKEDIFAEATEAVEVAEEEAEIKNGRAIMPKLDWMITQGIVKAGDIVYYKKQPTKKATIQANAKVKYDGKTISLLDFAKQVTGWTNVNAYRNLILEGTNKTLADIREEKMKELGM